MPVKTWDTKADFDAVYNIGLEPQGHPGTRAEIRGNYERSALFNASVPYLDRVTREWSAIVAQFAWPFDTSILIVGAGFGWSIEYLQAQGFTAAWGQDTSLWIQQELTTIDSRTDLPNSLVDGRISFGFLNSDAGRRRIRKDTIGPQPSRRFDVVITERVLSSLTDAEAQQMSTDIRADLLSGTGELIHIEHGPGPRDDTTGWNWQTIDAWKLVLPADTFVESFTAARVL